MIPKPNIKEAMPVLHAAFKEALKAPDAEFRLSQRMDAIDLYEVDGRIHKQAGEEVHCTLTVTWTRRKKVKKK